MSARRAPATLVHLLALLLGAAAVLWLVASPETGEPHDVPVGIVGPPVVAQLVGDQLDPEEVTTVAVGRASEAEQQVADGTLAGAVVVDLAATEDTLLLSRHASPDVRRLLQDTVREDERSLGRTVVVRPVGSDPDRFVQLDRLALAALLAGVLGGAALVVSRFGARLRGVRRPTAVALASAGGLLVALALVATPALRPEGALAGSVATLALVVVGGALLVFACGTSAGTAGLAVAGLVGLVTAAPLIGHVDDRLLPGGWRQLFGWTQPGAARDALTALADGRGAVRPLLVLTVWTVVGVVACLVAFRLRGRQGGPTEFGVARTAVAVAPVALLALLPVVLLPDTGEAEPVREPLVTTTQCMRVGSPRTVPQLNQMIEEARGPAWGGGDVGADVRLSDDRQLWLFGDTVRSAGTPGGRFVRNSMLLFDRDCIAVVQPPGGGAIIPDRDAEVGYWPMAVGAVARPGYDLVAVTAQRVRSTGGDEFDFEGLGPAVAVYLVPRGGTPQLLGVRDIGPDSTDRRRPVWGAAGWIADGWLYLYGTATTEEDLVFGYSLRVARMRPEQVLDRSAWRYWDGERWSRRAADATELIPARDGVSQTLSVFEQGGVWYALSKRNDFLGDELVAWTAPGPTGPFTPGPALADLPSDLDSGRLRYMPLAHPAVLPSPGTVLVSYSNNRTDVREIEQDPTAYRPRFLRVTLPQP